MCVVPVSALVTNDVQCDIVENHRPSNSAEFVQYRKHLFTAVEEGRLRAATTAWGALFLSINTLLELEVPFMARQQLFKSIGILQTKFYNINSTGKT